MKRNLFGIMLLSGISILPKANAQTIELTPALVLESGKTFRHGYRNVIVVKKMTFPNDKLQIGRAHVWTPVT